jgi:hypothetical protein
MRPFACVLVCLLLVYALAAAVAPGWVRRAGLDAWNWGRDEGRLRDAAAQQREVDDQFGAAAERHQVGTAIAARLLAGGSRAEAVAAVLALAARSPEWFAALRHTYGGQGLLPPGAPDRDVAALYLRLKLALARQIAADRGDTGAATATAERLARFDAEGVSPGDLARAPAAD